MCSSFDAFLVAGNRQLPKVRLIQGELCCCSCFLLDGIFRRNCAVEALEYSSMAKI